jgi:uncharacterized glyoxalase superfamily protein PhnB
MPIDPALPTVYPSFRYRDAPAAIAWLTKAFGLTESFVVPGEGGTIAHAELTWRSGVIMLGSWSDGADGRIPGGNGATWIYLAVDDADEHHRRAVQAGAEVIRPLETTDYGSRGYTALDPEGNSWSFGTYQPGPAKPGD